MQPLRQVGASQLGSQTDRQTTNTAASCAGVRVDPESKAGLMTKRTASHPTRQAQAQPHRVLVSMLTQNANLDSQQSTTSDTNTTRQILGRRPTNRHTDRQTDTRPLTALHTFGIAGQNASIATRGSVRRFSINGTRRTISLIGAARVSTQIASNVARRTLGQHQYIPW